MLIFELGSNHRRRTKLSLLYLKYPENGFSSKKIYHCKSTKTESIKVHYADLDADDEFARENEWIDLKDEPDHQELCSREQRQFLKAIREDLDLTEPTEDAVNSLKIAFACDESVKTGRMIDL